MVRSRSWLGWILVPIGLLVVAIPGMWLFMSATAPVLHPNPRAIPSVTHTVPPPQSASAVEQARQIVRASLSEENLPGLSAAVGVGGGIVWAEGFGWADIENRVPVTPDTRFRIGTASKVLTSAAVGLLLEQGRLQLDDEIQTYVPEFPKKPWPVTLRQLMGHVAGVRTANGDAGFESPLFSQRCERPVEALRFFADRELLFEPRTQYRYSNYGWVVVSAAVETAAEQPFLTFMQEQIFAPLRMQDTFAESATDENPEHVGETEEDFPLFTFIQKEILEPLRKDGTKAKPAAGGFPAQATFYFPRFEGDPRYGLHLLRPHNLSCYAGSMAFLSTPSDLVRFGLAINSGKLLQPATVQLLQTSQQLTSGQETGYGLGWDLETVTLAGEPTLAVGHDGESLGGRVVSLMMFRERRIVVAVTSNISYADTFSLAVRIAEAFAQAAHR